MDTIKVTEYDTFSLRPDVQDMSGMRFHDMYLCISGLFELKQMVAAAHAGLRGGQGATGFGGSAAPPLARPPTIATNHPKTTTIATIATNQFDGKELVVA